MSLTESWASQLPSRHSTSEWTIDCGWTTTSIRSPGTAKRCDASISSSPLLTMVAESIEILAPIDQVGWASASSRRIAPKVARSRRRKGPPEAVSTSRRTSSGRPARSAWWSAECSLSIGRIAAPVRGGELGEQPAGDHQRLLVGERHAVAGGERGGDRRQPRGADHRGDHPVDPGAGGGGDQALGADRQLDAGRQRGRERGRRPRGRSPRPGGRRTPVRAAASASGSRPCAASATTRKRSGWCRTTSSALLPIDPVAPSSARPIVTAPPRSRRPRAAAGAPAPRRAWRPCGRGCRRGRAARRPSP